MSHPLLQRSDDLLEPDRALSLRYEGENDQLFFVSSADGARRTVPKNRNVPALFLDQRPQPLAPAFRLLLAAFVGLAPAGLGTLVLAPLAALWALAMLFTRPLTRYDRIRVIAVWGIAAGLLGLAIPMSMLFLAHLSP